MVGRNTTTKRPQGSGRRPLSRFGSPRALQGSLKIYNWVFVRQQRREYRVKRMKVNTRFRLEIYVIYLFVIRNDESCYFFEFDSESRKRLKASRCVDNKYLSFLYLWKKSRKKICKIINNCSVSHQWIHESIIHVQNYLLISSQLGNIWNNNPL